MKNLFLIAALSAVTVTFGQTFEAKTFSNGGGFDTSAGVSTGDSLALQSSSFEVFQTASGSKYLKAISSRTGNEYAVWVGSQTEFSFEDNAVYESRSGAFCVYLIGKSGFPYAKYLDKVAEAE